MKKGDCIYMRSPGTSIRHLWIVASDVKSDGKCVIVNVTTMGHICDKTVVLHKGDHPFIEHDSVIRYSDAIITTDKALEAAIRGGAAERKVSCSNALITEIFAGIELSEDAPLDVKAFCGFSVSTTLPPNTRPKTVVKKKS